MSEILFLTICNKRALEDVVDIHTQRVIQQHRMLGYRLSNFKPDKNDMKLFNSDLNKYKTLKQELKENGFRELILKFTILKPEILPKVIPEPIKEVKIKPIKKRVKPQKYQHKQVEFKPVKVVEMSEDIKRMVDKLIADNKMLIGQLNTFNPNSEHERNLSKIKYERYLNCHKRLKEFCPNLKVEEWYTGVSYKLALDPTIIPLRRARVLAVLGRYCHECGCRENLELHHKIWQSRGGTDVISNMEVLCDCCHDRVHGVGQIFKVMLEVTA